MAAKETARELFARSGLRVERVTITRRGGRPYLFVSAEFDDVSRLSFTPAFPDLTFLQLVFGRRRCPELSDMYVDCNVDDHTDMVLDALFPPFKGTMWLGN